MTTAPAVPAHRRRGWAGTGSGLPGWVLVPAVVGGIFIVLPLLAMLARV
ncbi:MAG: molybdate ABC transporter permease subunit, partial [Nakamurella sp.]